MNLPRQVALAIRLFPASEWATSLVNAVNQFSIETVQALRFALPKYKTLDLVVVDDAAALFPIDFPVEASPVDVWVAHSGDAGLSSQAVTVKWEPIVGNQNQLCVRVNLITGLALNSTYSIRLGYR